MYRKNAFIILSIILCLTLPGWAVADLTKGDFIPRKLADESGEWYTAISYTIEKGDTLWGLSRRYQVDLSALLATNNFDQNEVLRIGQSINIPARSTMIHQVQPGESLWEIARSYDLSLQDILALNRGINSAQIQAGEYLQIPDRIKNVAVYNPSRGSLFNCIWPLQGAISSHFGSRSLGYHHGMDVVGDIGDTVKAASSGKVNYVGYNDIYGNMIKIDHGNGYETLYAHLKKSLVTAGDYVATGSRIGQVGITGRTTGPHLHFEVRYQGKAQDPINYLK